MTETGSLPSLSPVSSLPLDTPYIGIKHALITLTQANGGLNRERPLYILIRDINIWLLKQPDNLIKIDNWIKTLSADEIETAMDGEELEAATVMRDAPEGTNAFFNRFFEEVV